MEEEEKEELPFVELEQAKRFHMQRMHDSWRTMSAHEGADAHFVACAVGKFHHPIMKNVSSSSSRNALQLPPSFRTLLSARTTAAALQRE